MGWYSEHEQKKIIAIDIAICSSLSVAGSLMIILCYFYWHCRHSQSTNRGDNIVRLTSGIICFIAITDFIDYSSELFGALAFLFGYWDGEEENWICLVQGIGTHLGSVASLGWTVVSSWLLRHVIEGSDFLSEIRQKYKIECVKIHCYVWGITAGCVLPVVLDDSYGAAEGHCWIKNKGHGRTFRWFLFYIPVWVAMIYMIKVYYKYYKLRQYQQGQGDTSSIVQWIRYFPVILSLCYLPATIKRIYDITGYENDNVEFVLQLFMYTPLMLIGFFDGILFGWLWFYKSQNMDATQIEIKPPNHSRRRTDTSLRMPSSHSTWSHDHIPNSSDQDCRIIVEISGTATSQMIYNPTEDTSTVIVIKDQINKPSINVKDQRDKPRINAPIDRHSGRRCKRTKPIYSILPHGKTPNVDDEIQASNIMKGDENDEQISFIELTNPSYGSQ